MQRIGVIGFGFSGLMVVANLVRRAVAPFTLYILDEKHDGVGVAYSTQNPKHLLNVRAGNLSAFADKPEDFVQWLSSADAAVAKTKLGLKHNYTAIDFAPRALYGAYLAAIWHGTQEMAAQKNIQLKLVPSRTVAVQTGNDIALLTERGDAIAVDKIVLASGHETKAIFPQVKSPNIIQNPWNAALDAAATWASPVLLIGSGLTAIDMVLSLRRAGYAGEIILTSRRGMMPQMHAIPSAIASFSAEEIAAAKTLRAMLRLLRKKIRECGEWRVAVDALRPHTQILWQRLSPREQQRFLWFLLPIWGVHRHRMAPEIAAVMTSEIAAAKARLVIGKKLEVTAEEGELKVQLGAEVIHPSRIINCTGFELSLAQSHNPLLKQLLANQRVEAHVTGLGIVADPHCRAWGNLHPSLYAIGSLLTGQLLESTAIPELRAQAQHIAASLTQ